jgi:hypothetical protein
MILGALNIPRVLEQSQCRTSEDYYLSVIGDYKVHSTVLMPGIEFAKAKEVKDPIDDSIFINDKETKLTFAKTIYVQNYLTTHFIGRAPYAFYGPKTKMGEIFEMFCENGDPSYERRYFGTEGAVGSNNSGANEMVTHSR